jgi:hypothetical protein
MKRSTFILPALGLWFTLLILACTLSTSEGPPTLVPRATATPLPTIGYATLSPDELPQEATMAAPVPPPEASLLNLMNEVDSDRLMVHVSTLQNFGTRNVNSSYTDPSRGIGAAYQYIRGEFEKIRTQAPEGNFFVLDHQFSITWAGITTTPINVVAFIRGTEVGAGTILVGAHYDSTSIDPEDGASLAPGANDNGSGIAAMLEIARILSTRQHRSSIIFVAFSAEEIGRVGSINFVRDYIKANDIELSAVINMDIIGSSTGPNGAVADRQIRIFSPGPNDGSASRQLARTINLIGFNHAPDMEIVMQDAEDRPDRYGDHLSFSESGYPAVRFTEMLEERLRQHSGRDTIDDVQAPYLKRSTQAILAVVTALADGPPPPRNIALRDNGNGTRTLVWEPVAGATGYVVALRQPNAMIYQQFETLDTSVTWDRFNASEFIALAISAKDSTGLMGSLSAEYRIP